MRTLGGAVAAAVVGFLVVFAAGLTVIELVRR